MGSTALYFMSRQLFIMKFAPPAGFESETSGLQAGPLTFTPEGLYWAVSTLCSCYEYLL